MKIALISKLWEPTSRYSIGGTGFVVGALADELIKRGHQVTLFASGDSRTKAKLVSVIPRCFADSRYSEPQYFLNIARAFEQAADFDVIDCHVEEKALYFSRLVKTPLVFTLEFGEFDQGQQRILNHYRGNNFIAISNALRKSLPRLNWLSTVYNGIYVDDFPFSSRHGNYLVFLGRLSPQKGPHLAIQLARKLKMKLFLAGKMSPEDQNYLDSQVKPYIDGHQIKYLGLVKYTEKKKLLKGALALISPIQYLEAFGLNLVEAMACGTPAIAFRRGAISEVIKNGVSGFVIPPDNLDAMAKAVLQAKELDRGLVRQWVEKNFPTSKMVEGYLSAYRKVLKKR